MKTLFDHPVQRLSTFRIDSVRRTPQGGLRVDAYLTRVGIFDYQMPDGSTIRELRPESEVFSPASLETLRGAPVTDLHPASPVSVENWKTLAVGHVGDDVEADGPYIRASLIINDAATIAKIEAGERVELSCGYSTNVQIQDGEHNGERYDAVQTDIFYNHVALGPKNWGRAGSEVALRLDAQGHVIYKDFTMGKPKKEEQRQADGEIVNAAAKQDAAESPAAETAPSAPAESKTDRSEEMLSRINELYALVSERLPAPMAAPAEVAAEPEGEQTKADADEIEARITSRIDRGIKVREAHRAACGTEARQDGKTDRELCQEALAAIDSESDFSSLDDDSLATVLSALVKTVRKDSASERYRIVADSNEKPELTERQKRILAAASKVSQ